MASGRTCYNLDGWMTSRDYVRQLFARATADADIAMVEGVMGMFDGASPTTLEGSTAEIARWLDAPVLLVVNAHGAARSLAATVAGIRPLRAGRSRGGRDCQPGRFPAAPRLAGGIASRCGARAAGGHAAPRIAAHAAQPPLGSGDRRRRQSLSPAVLDQLADACEKHLNVPLLLELARSAGPLDVAGSAAAEIPVRSKVRMGIARDEAFHFYYPDNLESMTESGAEWVPFSPLADMRLPADLDGLYFGGGYPEVYADRLAANAEMLADVRSFAASGRAIYAECGGLMYLGRALTDIDGVRYPLAGVLPIETAMLEKLRVLGYTEVAWAADSLWGRAGEVARGHEFHYSRITADFSPAEGWRPAYSLGGRRASSGCEGFVKGRLQAGYVHLHWASRPEAIDHFLSCCEERS